MPVSQLKQKKTKLVDEQKPKVLLERMDKFKSNELVIGLAFPLGTSTLNLITSIKNYFTLNDYTIKVYKISELIQETMDSLVSKEIRDEIMSSMDLKPGDVLYPDNNEFLRINNLQLAGNFIREKFESSVLAQLVIRKIALDRMEKAKGPFKELEKKGELPQGMNLSSFSTSSHYIPEKTVYIINSLKNPAEAEVLKAVYGDLFYLIGAIQSKEERIENLASRIKIPRTKKEEIKNCAKNLEEKDQKQSDDHGQQLDKTLNHCDFFISISKADKTHIIDAQVKRFLDLVHGLGINTPTSDEHGMYVAYSAGLGSACLSRQVGASMSDNKGNIISTGCNDVPKFKGGLYIASDKVDERCFNNEGYCRNDSEKLQMKDDIADILRDMKVENFEAVTTKIFKEARIKDLIEFSRAVHAEMEAIVSLSRRGGGTTQGATLFTTTFPCHNCARHIVAAGIERVVFIEPYDKSLALELHQDSITRVKALGKLPFDHFTGVSPTKYAEVFKSSGVRKNSSGKFSGISKKPTSRTLTYLEAYRDLEQRTNDHLNHSGLILR